MGFSSKILQFEANTVSTPNDFGKTLHDIATTVLNRVTGLSPPTGIFPDTPDPPELFGYYTTFMPVFGPDGIPCPFCDKVIKCTTVQGYKDTIAHSPRSVEMATKRLSTVTGRGSMDDRLLNTLQKPCVSNCLPPFIAAYSPGKLESCEKILAVKDSNLKEKHDFLFVHKRNFETNKQMTFEKFQEIVVSDEVLDRDKLKYKLKEYVTGQMDKAKKNCITILSRKTKMPQLCEKLGWIGDDKQYKQYKDLCEEETISLCFKKVEGCLHGAIDKHIAEIQSRHLVEYWINLQNVLNFSIPRQIHIVIVKEHPVLTYWECLEQGLVVGYVGLLTHWDRKTMEPWRFLVNDSCAILQWKDPVTKTCTSLNLEQAKRLFSTVFVYDDKAAECGYEAYSLERSLQRYQEGLQLGQQRLNRTTGAGHCYRDQWGLFRLYYLWTYKKVFNRERPLARVWKGKVQEMNYTGQEDKYESEEEECEESEEDECQESEEEYESEEEEWEESDEE